MKRGSSGLSLLIGVDKPTDMSSHDVVSCVRRMLGEKRIGHAGTLDPFASGVLLLLVGPAARLDKYLASHDKEYVADITFGFSTDTDDCTGEVLHSCEGKKDLARLLDPGFANAMLDRMLGDSMQLPPVYSAIKRSGRKACDEARKGNIIELDPRPITIYSADLIRIIEDEDTVTWRVRLAVSKGTYIRSIARDLGLAVEVPAHLSALRRTRAGDLPIEACVTLEQLERDEASALIDPVSVLGYKLLFADDDMGKRIGNGSSIPLSAIEETMLFEPISPNEMDPCGCLPSIVKSNHQLQDGELVSIVVGNCLKAICSCDIQKDALVPDCVLNIGVARG